jgi:outer membrane protein assembly factor BamB
VTPDEEPQWPQYARDARNSRCVPRRRPGYRRQPAPAYELPQALSAPVVAGGVVAYTRDASGSPGGEYQEVIELAAYGLATGEPLWAEPLHPPSSGSDSYSPAIAGDVVCVAVSDLLAGFDLHSGRQRWELTGSPYGLADDDELSADAPTVVGSTLYVRGGGRFRAVDARTGRVRWSRRPDRSGDAWIVPCSPVVDGTAVVGCDDGFAVALDASTGTLRWPAVTSPTLEFAPCGAGDLVVVASGDRVYGLDLASGERRWRHRIGEPVSGGLACTDQAVLVTTPTAARALSAEDGRPLWTRRLPGTLQPPSVAGDVVVVPTEDPHQVHGIGLEDGERCWTVRLSGRESDPVLQPEAVVVGDRLLVTTGGRVTVLAFSDE